MRTPYKFPCCVCKKPVDITDLVIREINLRIDWRSRYKEDINWDHIFNEHPVILACHEKCGDNKQRWFKWKCCEIPGCCVPACTL